MVLVSLPERHPRRAQLLALPLGGGWHVRVDRCGHCAAQPYQVWLRSPNSDWQLIGFAGVVDAALVSLTKTIREFRRAGGK